MMTTITITTINKMLNVTPSGGFCGSPARRHDLRPVRVNPFRSLPRLSLEALR
jgi:hypothetical protein